MDNSSDRPILDRRLRHRLEFATRSLGILQAVDKVPQIVPPNEGLYLLFQLKIVLSVMAVIPVEVAKADRASGESLSLMRYVPR